ncbi:MAG: S-methylmethionine-dependent homocysteine/selenocysteine methylase [Parasphingorhabdus sp.]|jgi:S-methylmethionine-dependent homocysteine/selenocysteine methylase
MFHHITICRTNLSNTINCMGEHMTYEDLNQRLQNGECLVLDGAIGTQLQRMDVPMDNICWAGKALHTHPDTIRHMHHKYLDCGVDILTTNTYASARHNLEPLGLGDSTRELNIRGVNLAQEARERFANRPVWIAGSVSNFGLTIGGESIRALHRHANSRTQISEQQAIANLQEQAEILADAGVDFLLGESTGSMAQRHWVMQACQSTGLPVWIGFRVRWNEVSNQVEMGYSDQENFADGLKQLLKASKPDCIALFHSTVESTNKALPILRELWDGPVALYPEADRSDYTSSHRDEAVATEITPEEFAKQAAEWKNDGIEVIGGCCGIDVEFIQQLRQAI